MSYLILLLALLGGNSATPSPTGQVIDIKAGDYFFQAPATAKPGLTTIRITSVLGNHLFQLYRLDGNHNAADLVATLTANKPHSWAKNLGGSGADYKGKESSAIFMLEPGRYAIVCPVHAPDHVRHFSKGMYSELTVEGKRVAGALPKPDVVITASEYIWRFSSPVRSGRYIIRFKNGGTVPHQLKFIDLYSSATEAHVRAWKSGDPRVPGTVATLAPLDPGGSVLAIVELPFAGNYLLQCVPQMAHGMLQHIMVR
jgi:hypothetical protein